MELTQENYNTQSSRHQIFRINGASTISVIQMPSVDDTTLWSEPRMHTFAVRLVDMEHADLFKDALDMAAIIFAAWSEDTGKEIAL